MWWFIIYYIIAYAVFTFLYFYLYNNYCPSVEYKEWQRVLGVTIASMLLGIFWIFIPIIIIIYHLFQSKQK